MKCTVCGTENPNNARFCGYCGSPAPEPTVNTDDTSFPADSSTNVGITETSEEYASDSNSKSSTDLPLKTELGENGEAISEYTSDPIPHEQSELSPTPMPVPTAPKRSIFSNSGLGNSFDYQKNTAVPKQGNNDRNEKEKKVVSLSVAVICIVAVFVLAVVCGILTQLYIRKSGSANHTGTAYSSGRTTEDKSGHNEFVLSHHNEIFIYCKGDINNG